jgi:bifunctional DNase/RNase
VNSRQLGFKTSLEDPLDLIDLNSPIASISNIHVAMKTHISAASKRIVSLTTARCNNLELHSKHIAAPRTALSFRHPSSKFRKQCFTGIHTSRCRYCTRPSAHYAPFPFIPDDYYRCSLQLLQSHEQMTMTGLMLFQKESEDGEIIDDGDGMIVAIGGDTFQAIVLLLQGRLEIRPLTVDLLCRFLEQAKSVSEKDWSMIRVAITDISESTFIGRIYFGDSTSQEISWDCDCRPSDGVFLALKHGAPIFIHQKVWASVSAPLDELKENAQWQMAHVNRELKAHREGDASEGVLLGGGLQQSGQKKLDVATLMTTVKRSDPEPLKLLKMELKVAIAEENYAEAARIRDHVFMKLSIAAATAKEEGDHEAAANYQKTLSGYIASMEDGGMPDHSDGTGDAPL